MPWGGGGANRCEDSFLLPKRVWLWPWDVRKPCMEGELSEKCGLDQETRVYLFTQMSKSICKTIHHTSTPSRVPTALKSIDERQLTHGPDSGSSPLSPIHTQPGCVNCRSPVLHLPRVGACHSRMAADGSLLVSSTSWGLLSVLWRLEEQNSLVQKQG